MKAYNKLTLEIVEAHYSKDKKYRVGEVEYTKEEFWNLHFNEHEVIEDLIRRVRTLESTVGGIAWGMTNPFCPSFPQPPYVVI